MNVYSSKQVRDACPVSFLFFSGVLEEKKKDTCRVHIVVQRRLKQVYSHNRNLCNL